MHPFLAATGPSFRQGYQIESLESVDVYPLMCHLLSVPPQPNNGSLSQARRLLANETRWNVPMVVGLVVGVMLVLTGVLGKSNRRRNLGTGFCFYEDKLVSKRFVRECRHTCL